MQYNWFRAKIKEKKKYFLAPCDLEYLGTTVIHLWKKIHQKDCDMWLWPYIYKRVTINIFTYLYCDCEIHIYSSQSQSQLQLQRFTAMVFYTQKVDFGNARGNQVQKYLQLNTSIHHVFFDVIQESQITVISFRWNLTVFDSFHHFTPRFMVMCARFIFAIL